MHAVVLTTDAQIALEDRPEPEAREGEVLIAREGDQAREGGQARAAVTTSGRPGRG